MTGIFFFLLFYAAEIKVKSSYSFLGWSPVTRVLMLKLCLYSPLLIHRLLVDSETQTHTKSKSNLLLLRCCEVNVQILCSNILMPEPLDSANICALVYPSYQHSL